MVEDAVPFQPIEDKAPVGFSKLPYHPWTAHLVNKEVVIYFGSRNANMAGILRRVEKVLEHRYYLVLEDAEEKFTFVNVDHIISIWETAK
jgi:hypothetical protein